MIADTSMRHFLHDLYYRLDSPGLLLALCVVLVAALVVIRRRK
jgi:hypothetical protein